jgi:acetyltransferase-like isoleucine patch superfamily enzyme
MLEILIQLLIIAFPWSIRRKLMLYIFRAEISNNARIGFSLIINVRSLKMNEQSRIGHFNVLRNLDQLTLGNSATIGTFNWIAGNPTGQANRHFHMYPSRRSELILGEQSAIVSRHIIDCTDAVSIGSFSTIAGFRSQILTHSIDLAENHQGCAPVIIGDFCFVGSGAIILKGAVLPNYSVLGAGAVLLEDLKDEWYIYAGNPARKIRSIDRKDKYFNRKEGFVN